MKRQTRERIAIFGAIVGIIGTIAGADMIHPGLGLMTLSSWLIFLAVLYAPE